MTHDLEDLLDLIERLEARIIELELRLDPGVKVINADDTWYWEHG